MIQSIHMQNRQKLSEIALASPAKAVDLEAQTLVADDKADDAPAVKRCNLGWIVALNVVLAATQILVGTSILSLTLVSDGFHNLSDAVAAFVGQLAESYDKRDYDKAQLPFGYARASTIGALINVAALLAICLSIALTALVRFWKPVAVDDLGALVAVSAMGLVANLVSALMAACGVEVPHHHHHHGPGGCPHDHSSGVPHNHGPGEPCGGHSHTTGSGWRMMCGPSCGGGPSIGLIPGPVEVVFSPTSGLPRGGGAPVCAPCPEPVKEEPPPAAAATLDVGRLAIVVHHLGDAANSLVVLGEALLLIYGHKFLPKQVMRGLGLYLDPALSILLSLAIAAAAWPVGKMAAWTLLEGSPVDGLEEELGKIAVVESSALLHLRDDPVDRAGLVRLRLRRGDKRRWGDVVAAARRVLKRFAADEHTYVEVVDAAGGSPKSVITQSRRTGPMFSGISCRPCK